MKKKQLLGAAIALMVMGNSCKNDAYRDLELENNGAVQFTSSIGGNVATRVTGNAWDSNDAIGVFMKQGAGLNSPLAANKKFTTGGNGNFSATGTDVIDYPETGTVDFIAYYPYTADLVGTTLPVSVASQANLSAIDVLYSNNATALSKTSGTANLTFTHKLSKVEFVVKGGNGVADVAGLSVAYNNVNTTASLDLATGTLSAAASPQNVTAKTTALTGTQAGSQFVEAILLPGDLSAKQVVFTVGANTFTWTIPANTTLEAGTKRTYDIVLQTTPTGNEVAVTGAGTITDWTTVPGGAVNVDLDEEQGGGTDPGTGTEEEFFFETFGEAGPTSNPRGRMGTYTDYDMTSPVVYSDSYADSWADIRATSTMNSHVWLPSARTTGIKIEGINGTGYTNLKLSYDLAANATGASAAVIKVRVNGVEKSVTGALGTSNTYSSYTIEDIAASNTLTVEFYANSAENEAGYRLDNIKLVGTK
ncbi:fimbrillin family protein [Sphingobacterium bambusae]|uniref:Fimbrillin family protein n=1 Tax=Sphingobacterium bambusae TaxID=662858 RepID=A0ABW6BDR1_9SPHI|nr:fimbrillin family protein [Sphingobacterium bambusae]WPL48587.1 fimbrillin family protein [Sphingobacterium bambusae]